VAKYTFTSKKILFINLGCSGFSIRTGVGGKPSGVGGEGTTQVEGMILRWGYMGAFPPWDILEIRTS